MRWTTVADPATFALQVLRDEAPEIPAELLDDQQWEQLTVPLAVLSVDESMVADHDAASVHCRRRDGFLDAIRRGAELPPLIAINSNHRLVDGYARLRALRVLGVSEASVVMQIIGVGGV